MKIIRHVSRAARYALFAVIVGSALALSVLRFWLLPEASGFRGQLQAKAGEVIGATVRIGSLSARMQGLEPQLVLHDFQILPKQADAPAIRLQRVRLGLSLMQSLLDRAPALTTLRLEGSRITLLRQPDGSIAIRGLEAGGGTPAWLFSLRGLSLRDIDLEWQDLQTGVASLPLGHLNASGINADSRHRFSVAMQPSPGMGKGLKVIADFRGAEADPRTWQGGIYLEGVEVPLGWTDGLFPVSIRGGVGSLRLWSDWQGGAMTIAWGNFHLARPIFAINAENQAEGRLAFDELQGRFRWDRTRFGWRVALNDLLMAAAGKASPEADLAVEFGRDDSDRNLLRAAVSSFRLEDLRILQGILPPGQLREALAAMAPRGLAQQMQFVLGLEGVKFWGICGNFKDVAFNAWDGIPGMKNLSGRICGNDTRGSGGFSIREGGMVYPRLWQKPVALKALEGAFNWERDGEKMRLAVPMLGLQAPGLHGQASLAVDLPGSGAAPFLDMKVRLSNVDAQGLRDYLPLAAMPDISARWFKEAFDAGRITRADVLFFGSLADFPFRAGEGVFQARADVENLELDFNPEWPHVTGISGRVAFDGPGMQIAAISGLIGGARILEARAQAGDIDRDQWLNIAGTVDTDLPQVMAFLAQTPLRQIPQRLLKSASPQGDTKIGLRLKICLPSDCDEVKVDGSAAFRNARLDFPALGVGIRQIAGDLRFSEHGLDVDDMSGSVMGQPVRLSARQGGEAIHVEMRGQAHVGNLRELLPRLPFWDYLQGSFGYRLMAEIPQFLDQDGEPLRLTMTSDLEDLDVRLPMPLGKPVGVKRESRLELALPFGGGIPLRAGYGREAQAQLWFAPSTGGYAFFGGDIHVGPGAVKWSREPGLRLQAKLADVDFAPWKSFAAQLRGRASSPDGILQSFALEAESVRWDGKKLGALVLDLARQGRDWKGKVESAAGHGHILLQAPEFGHPLLNMDLDVLRLPEIDKGAVKEASVDDLAADSMPVIQLHARQTLWRGANLGTLELLTERWTQGLNIKSLILRHPDHELELKGSWMQTDGRSETRLDGKLNIEDLGIFLEALGYAKEIRDTPTAAKFSLTWPGAPHQLSAARVRGGIDLELGRGSILKMEPGLGRALAVLNLDSLRRLLMLDFSDLFGKGLSYDDMRGRFELGGGHARTSSFLIDAVAGTILISGRVGLVQKDLDETVTVIPHTLASLPIGGVMVGGAAVGAAISMAGKLMGQDSVSIASNRYAIKGSWDNPQVSRIEGNMPLDVLNRAWSGLKNFSGFGSKGEEGSE